MCGRTCLTLEPDGILRACKYISRASKTDSKVNEDCCLKNHTESLKAAEPQYIMPEWRSEFNCGRKYTPSYNIAPSDITPVLVSGEHFANSHEVFSEVSRLVVPMMWGMVPFWHKGDYRKHGLTTNNCRLEHLLESKLYSKALKRGQRCVVLCEGFYEWKTTNPCKPSQRPSYLIFMPQLQDVKIHDKTTWSKDGINLLKMAGLFDSWEDENGDKIYSYSVITFESNNLMSWLHHRMPAILQTDEDVNDWLDYRRIPAEKALQVLRPATDIKWYRVSSMVNNSRNKSDQCNKPIDLCKSEKTSTNKSNSILKWLTVQKRPVAHLTETSNDKSDEEQRVDAGSNCALERQKRPKHFV